MESSWQGPLVTEGRNRASISRRRPGGNPGRPTAQIGEGKGYLLDRNLLYGNHRPQGAAALAQRQVGHDPVEAQVDVVPLGRVGRVREGEQLLQVRRLQDVVGRSPGDALVAHLELHGAI